MSADNSKNFWAFTATGRVVHQFIEAPLDVTHVVSPCGLIRPTKSIARVGDPGNVIPLCAVCKQEAQQ